MKQKLWRAFGQAAFWITWPGIWLVIKLTPPRTRVLVIHKGQLLLVKDWLGSGRWKLPGGGLRRHEPAAAGAVRELKEETDLDLPMEQLKYLGDFSSKSNGFSAHIVCFTTELKDKPQVILSKFEVTDSKWIPLSELPKTKLSQTTRTAVAKLVGSGQTSK